MKQQNVNFFKGLSIITALICACLFFTLLLNSDLLLNSWGLQSSVTTYFLAKKASIFMLGISVLMFCSKDFAPSKPSQIICLATGITMLGLACMGSYELIMRNVNSSILTAIIIETTLGASFGRVIYMNRNIETIRA